METFTLSEAAVAVLRFEIKGWKAKSKGARLAVYRELAAAGIMEPVPGTEADYRFTDEGYARREEILREEEDRIERQRVRTSRRRQPVGIGTGAASPACLRRARRGHGREPAGVPRAGGGADSLSGLDLGGRPGSGVPLHPGGLGAAAGVDHRPRRRRSPSLIVRASARASCRMGSSVSGPCS